MQTIPTEEIYDALFDDDALGRLSTLMARAGDARSALLQWRHVDGTAAVMGYEYYTDQYIAEYQRAYFAYDPWVAATLARPERFNAVSIVDKYVPQPAFERSVLFNEFVRAQNDDTYYCMGGVVNSAWGQGILSVQRGRTQKPFDEDNVANLSRIAMHVERVLRVRGEIAAHQRIPSIAKLTLDAIDLVVVITDRSGRILEANRCADSVFREQAWLRSRHGVLHAADPNSERLLMRAIYKATSAKSPSASTVVLPLETGFGCFVSVSPLSKGPGPRKAMVLCRIPNKPLDNPAGMLASLFKLSPAESAVALMLASGRTPEQMALARGVELSTLRTQLKSLAAKMGCRRQAEIVSVISQLPPIAA